MLKGLFYKAAVILVTGTIVSTLMIGYVFISRERLRQVLVALGQDPGPGIISPYENGHVWSDDEWHEWIDKNLGNGEGDIKRTYALRV
jgi:hypothetical protein